MIASTRALTALALILSLVQAAAAQRPPLMLSTGIGEYYGTVYIPRAAGGAEYVLLRGQPFVVNIALHNNGGATTVRAAKGKSAPFRVRVSAIDTAVFVPELSVSPVPTRGPGVVELRLPITLQRKTGLVWDVSIPPTLPAGRYRVQILSDLDQKLSLNSDFVDLEIRDVVSLADRVESLRIEATRAQANNDLAGQDAAARRLLGLHPQSAFGHALLGWAAHRRGDDAGARAAYARAIEILRTRRDTLYAAVATEHSMKETLAAFEMRLNELR